MKTRKEIEEEISEIWGISENPPWYAYLPFSSYMTQMIMLTGISFTAVNAELLLDIRDLLANPPIEVSGKPIEPIIGGIIRNG